MNGPQAALIGFAIRFRGIVVGLSLVLLLAGLLGLSDARYDVFPEFAPPQVGIQTEAPGLAPEQVEALVTRPVEGAVLGSPGVRVVRSNSTQGLSVVSVFLDPRADLFRLRAAVAERLAVAAQRLPQGVAAPELTPLTSSSQMLLVLGLTSERASAMALRTLADGALRLRLLAVPGVADVGVFGGERRTLQVQVHPARLAPAGLGLGDVAQAARRAVGMRGAGFVDTPNQRIVLDARAGKPAPDTLARAVVTGGVFAGGGAAPGRVSLGDVAAVVVAPGPAIGGAAIGGAPGVILNVSEAFGADTLRVTRAVEAVLAELRPGLEAQGVVLHADLFRPADFIAITTGNIAVSLGVGAVLVAAVLVLFLADLRTAAISCAAIPLSLLAATLVLQRLGYSLNTMTLGGLAIAIGEVVDDAVIDVENIVRRLRENRRLAAPRPERAVVLDACLEVRGAVVYASFAVIVVFLPVVFLPGIAGRLFAPLGVAYVLAVAASLGVALVVTPALSAGLLVGRALRERDPASVRWSRAAYERLLGRMSRRPGVVLLCWGVLVAAGLSVLPFLGTSFIPELKETHFTLHMSAVPGTSVEESLRVGVRVADALKRLPVVRSLAQRVGRAALSADTWGPNYSEFELDLQPGLSGAQTDAARQALRAVLSRFVGVNFALKTFLGERIEETVSGFAAPVAIGLHGGDLDALDRVAAEVARVLGGVAGASGVQVESPPGQPSLQVRLRPAAVARLGLDQADVLEAVRIAYGGDVAGEGFDADGAYDVLTVLDPASRADLRAIASLPLRAADGTRARLGDVAEIYEAGARAGVLHQGGQRLQSVTCSVDGGDVAGFVARARARIASQVVLPPGVTIDFGGTAQAQSDARRDLLVNAALGLAGVVSLLAVVTGSARTLLLVMLNLPFALVGGVVAVFATGGVLTLGSTVGFVTLFGITLRNSIMMVSHYARLAEGGGWDAAMAIRGAGDRLVPILMTSLVTGLGLLPLAVGLDEPGREIEGPMAIVILGGLATSMALNLLVLPLLAMRHGRFGGAGR